MAQAKKWRRVGSRERASSLERSFRSALSMAATESSSSFSICWRRRWRAAAAPGLFEGGLFFAFVLVVGEGAFGPAPKGGLLVQGSGRSAAANCPYLIGSREVAGWAEHEIDMEAGVAFDGFVRLPLPGFG